MSREASSANAVLGDGNNGYCGGEKGMIEDEEGVVLKSHESGSNEVLSISSGNSEKSGSPLSLSMSKVKSMLDWRFGMAKSSRRICELASILYVEVCWTNVDAVSFPEITYSALLLVEAPEVSDSDDGGTGVELASLIFDSRHARRSRIRLPRCLRSDRIFLVWR
jgi:hypothetical protein